jgi:trehalose 6-phosphate synthase/phosphatase
LTLPEEDRRGRMEILRMRVLSHDVHQWANTFVESLKDASARPDHVELVYTQSPEIESIVGELRAASSLALLLDYDGTLVPIALAPDLAKPSKTLKALLVRLAERGGREVHIVSGRALQTLDKWFSDLPIHLHAEHGFWSRPAGGEWAGLGRLSDSWRRPAHHILRAFAERTPGSLVEEKHSSVAWHYRLCDAEFGQFQANELKAHLSALLTNSPVELLAGDKVVELRPHGASKGRVVREILAQAPATARVVAFGDDVTDEEMFGALGREGFSFHVGPAPSRARFRLESVAAVHRLLEVLAE